LGFERLGKQAIDIVVAIVGEDESAMANVFFQVLALFAGKLHEFMSAQVTKRATENLIAAEWYNVLGGVNRQSGVFDKRIENIDRHPLIHIPVPRLVLKAGKKEFIAGCHAGVSSFYIRFLH
jgi:hypothetical protein